MLTPYRFVTTFSIPAPQPAVFETLSHLDRWASKWPAAETVVVADGGGPDGTGRSVAAILRAPMGYVIGVQFITEHIEPPTRLDVIVEGDVRGWGSWRLTEADGVTSGSYLWEVVTTKRWMNLLAPLARPVFEWNHDRTMQTGLEAVSAHLGVKPLEVMTTTWRDQDSFPRDATGRGSPGHGGTTTVS